MAEQALTEPEQHTTWWGRAHADAVLAALSGSSSRLDRRLFEPATRTLTGSPLLVASRTLERLGIDTTQSWRLRERAQRYAQRIDADYWNR